jgi:hypothetical protein
MTVYDLKIGQRFKFKVMQGDNWQVYKVKEDNGGCSGCCFFQVSGLWLYICEKLRCFRAVRKDNKNVIIIKDNRCDV